MRISQATLDKLMETLAGVEHERWSHWQQYMHNKCERKSDGSLVIPSELVTQWERQLATSYSELTEAEKQSDRDQVSRYLPIILKALGIVPDPTLSEE
jgi:Zn-dependent M32 family carboxypeptidase